MIAVALIASILIGEYFVAAEISILLQIGELLEDYTINRAKKGISKLISLSAKKVKIVKKENNISTLKEVYASDVKISEVVRVFSGDIIALDGVVVSG